mmetsp:Transcript_17516/g.38874  ORF Transcript_17516/g.38874 Transcript_17516/m.38874 type:complete len:418 (-) Transcript_17516:44-1297(-)
MASTSVSNNLASTPPPPRRRAYSSITGSDRVFLRQDGENEGRMPILSSPSRAEGRRRPIRPRSASTSVILAFDGSQIPRFNENLASLIAGMASEEETEVQRRSHSAFSTPVRRRSNESYLDIQRERAHTCPRINGHYAATNAEDMGGEGRDEESGYQRIETYEESLENNAIIETPPERMTSPRTSPPFASRGGAQPDTSAMDSTRNDANLLPSVPQSTPIPARRAIVRIASPQRITTPGVRAGDNIIFRINPFVMKMMMMLSLYIILAYTWKTDLRSRYMSNEINYGLSEYWDGGIAQQRVARIGRDQGKLFNDDLGDGVVGDLPGVSSPTLSDIMRRPSLSHAHIPDSSHPVYEVQIRRVFESKWSFTRVCWYVIWLCFMLPVVEAFVAELKRYARGRHMYYQRLRNVRNYNAHDL